MSDVKDVMGLVIDDLNGAVKGLRLAYKRLDMVIEEDDCEGSQCSQLSGIYFQLMNLSTLVQTQRGLLQEVLRVEGEK